MTDDLIRRGDAIAKIKERASGKSSSGLVLTVDAAIDALAALPRSSSQRSKERAMTDDEELIARLRNTPNWMREGFQNWKDNVRTYDTAPFEAAARIETLVKEKEQLGREVNMARYGQPDFAWSVHEDAMADLEAKLAKALEALLWCSGSADFNEGGVAREGWLKVCAPLLKGESHE